MTRPVEKYYSVQELEVLLSRSDRWVIQQILAGVFGNGVVDVGTDGRKEYRVPASGVNAFLDKRRVFSESEPEPGVFARGVGELRRKLKGVQAHG